MEELNEGQKVWENKEQVIIITNWYGQITIRNPEPTVNKVIETGKEGRERKVDWGNPGRKT